MGFSCRCDCQDTETCSLITGGSILAVLRDLRKMESTFPACVSVSLFRKAHLSLEQASSLSDLFGDYTALALLSGQLRFWNPDDLNASQSGSCPPQDWIEEKLQEVCEDLGITRDGHLNRKKLVSICEQYGLQHVDAEVSPVVCCYSGAIEAEPTIQAEPTRQV